jgi:hypothetical protein
MVNAAARMLAKHPLSVSVEQPEVHRAFHRKWQAET